MDEEKAKIFKKVVKDLKGQQSAIKLKSVKFLKHKLLHRTCDPSVVSAFCEYGGVKLLTSLLFTAHKEDLFDYTLSILANICVNYAEARKQVVEENGIKAVGRILNGLKKQSIQDRACRLLGNLTKDPISHESIQENQDIIVYVIDYAKFAIKEKNEFSIRSAIRTLRYIIQVSSKCAEKVIEQKTVSVLVALIKNSKFNMYEPLLTILHEISLASSENSFHQQVVQSDLLPIMVKFTTHENSKLKHLSLSFIVNISPHLAEQVGNAGGIPLIIESVNDRTSHSLEMSDLVQALNSLLFHPNNRHRMNENGGLECLMKILKSEICEDFEFSRWSIINALLQCLYDDVSMSRLLELDIIPSLLNQLVEFINKKSGNHELSEELAKNRSKLDLSVFDVCAEDIRSLLQQSFEEDLNCENKFDVEPSSDVKEDYSINSPSYQMILVNQSDTFDTQAPSTSMQSCSLSNLYIGYSPCSSTVSPNLSPSSETYSPLGCISPVSPSSPMSIASDISACLDDVEDFVYSDEEPSDSKAISDYSPKCVKKRRLTSDFKNWGKQRRKSGGELKQNIEVTTVKRKKNCEESGPTSDQKFMDAIFTILARYTWKVDDKPIPKCVIEHIPRYFDVFLSFINNIPLELSMKKYGHSIRPFYSACKTLCRIASDCECLGKIIKNQIPKLVQNISESLPHGDKSCEQCYVIRRLCRKILERDLKAVAESRMGQSKLQELMSHSLEDKIKISQVLPSLVSSRKLLQKFYLHLELIPYLLNTLKEEYLERNFADSVRSVHNLSKILGLKHTANNLDDEKLPVKCLYDKDDKLCDVWFVLGEGSKVGACKAVLINTDFFRAMFCGNFSETEQSSIKVEDASLDAFCLMMHYLHCYSIPCDCSVDLMLDHKTILELLYLADKYLLKDLQYSLHEQIINCVTEENAADIYCAASLIQDKFLVDSTLRFVMIGNMDMASRVKCFEKLMTSEFKSLVLHHIEKLLRNRMAP